MKLALNGFTPYVMALHLTCHLLYNIDDSNENATQTSSLKTDNARETVRG